jgi:hypothetical protein
MTFTCDGCGKRFRPAEVPHHRCKATPPPPAKTSEAKCTCHPCCRADCMNEDACHIHGKPAVCGLCNGTGNLWRPPAYNPCPQCKPTAAAPAKEET